MLETFYSNTSRDFRQRYQGSFGYYTVPESKKRVLVYLDHVDETTTTFIDEHKTVYKANADTGVEFDFIPVSKKLFVIDDALFLIQRRPARMWQRGVSGQNTHVYQITDKGPYNRGLTFKHVLAAFASPDADVLTKLKEIEEKKRTTVALSNTFGVANGQFFVYDETIGTFNATTKEIKLNEPLFRQEVVDLVGRLGISYKVSHD